MRWRLVAAAAIAVAARSNARGALIILGNLHFLALLPQTVHRAPKEEARRLFHDVNHVHDLDRIALDREPFLGPTKQRTTILEITRAIQTFRWSARRLFHNGPQNSSFIRFGTDRHRHCLTNGLGRVALRKGVPITLAVRLIRYSTVRQRQCLQIDKAGS
jgi:hypothetical protein